MVRSSQGFGYILKKFLIIDSTKRQLFKINISNSMASPAIRHFDQPDDSVPMTASTLFAPCNLTPSTCPAAS
jgi:hypothetical protein